MLGHRALNATVVPGASLDPRTGVAPMSDVAIETITLEDEAIDSTRLTLGLGLLIGACAYMCMWTLIAMGVKAVLG